MSENPITDALIDRFAADPDCSAYRYALEDSHADLERAANAMEEILQLVVEHGDCPLIAANEALAQYRRLSHERTILDH